MTKTNTATRFGDRIREAREAAGLTQGQVGEALNPPITYQMVWKYEQGRTRISAETVGQLSKLLKVEPGFFYT